MLSNYNHPHNVQFCVVVELATNLPTWLTVVNFYVQIINLIKLKTEARG